MSLLAYIRTLKFKILDWLLLRYVNSFLVCVNADLFVYCTVSTILALNKGRGYRSRAYTVPNKKTSSEKIETRRTAPNNLGLPH